MTREKAKKLMPIIKEFAEGRTIQYLGSTNKWIDSEDPNFGLDPSKYRIKPEPKLVPFTFEDRKDILGKVVMRKDGLWIANVHLVSKQHVRIGITCLDYKQFLELCVFEDGSPCGKYVEE